MELVAEVGPGVTADSQDLTSKLRRDLSLGPDTYRARRRSLHVVSFPSTYSGGFTSYPHPVGTRYCPECGSEYRSGFEVCADCGASLVDEPPAVTTEARQDGSADHLWVQVMTTGRSMDAEIIRSFLEGNGLRAEVWTSGMGRWRAESAITEVTGVPSDFNSHRVMVPDDQLETAQGLLAASEVPELEEEDWALPASRSGYGAIGDTGAGFGYEIEREPIRWMTLFRSRWVLVVVALFTLVLIVLGALR